MKPTKKTASTKTTTTTKPASTAAATANKGPLSGNTGKKFAHFFHLHQRLHPKDY